MQFLEGNICNCSTINEPLPSVGVSSDEAVATEPHLSRFSNMTVFASMSIASCSSPRVV